MKTCAEALGNPQIEGPSLAQPPCTPYSTTTHLLALAALLRARQPAQHPSPSASPPQPPPRRRCCACIAPAASCYACKGEGASQGAPQRAHAGCGMAAGRAAAGGGGLQLHRHPAGQRRAPPVCRVHANGAEGVWGVGARLRRCLWAAGRRRAVAAVLTWKIPGNVWRPPRRLRVAGPRVPLEFGPS